MVVSHMLAMQPEPGPRITLICADIDINGLIEQSMSGVMRNGGMNPGDVLLPTKPIGTGTLFAANARHAVKGRWISVALASMTVSN